jgi:WhiB family transcriptional regulator, redox-sensing transcriptional regulator
MSEPWMEAAACRGRSDLFFFTKGGEAAAKATQAKAICATCIVLKPCRAYALAHPWLHGIWGGMSVNDRQAARIQAIRTMKV